MGIVVMKIIDLKSDIQLRSKNTKLHLLQPSVSLNPINKRIQNPEKVWSQISIAVNHLENDEPCESRIIVFPEVSVPRIYLLDTLDLIFNKFSRHTVTIIGLELCTVKECESLLRNLQLLDNEPFKLFDNVNKERLVNACLIALQNEAGNFKVLFQPKLTPSKFEGSLDQLADIVCSYYLYRLVFIDASILVLICSDFFNRPPGSVEKIIDIVSRHVFQTGISLDFLFNIQYNPSVDHPLFLNSIERFYDDGYMSRATVCLVQVNSLIDNDHGAKSKILFYKETPLPRTEPVKQIKAPVVGYELGDKASTTSITFKRLPIEWDKYRDKYPFNIQAIQINKDKLQPQPLEGISYVMPTESLPSIDLSSYRDVCEKLSEVGNLQQAEEWARYGFKQYLKEKRWRHAAALMQFVAIQLRHSGILDKSLQAYASAEEVLRRIDDQKFDDKLLDLRIRAGRVMVEEYLIRGNGHLAIQRYQNIIDELDEYLKEYTPFLLEGEIRSLNRYKLHGMRQQGEMYRLIGHYLKALKLYRHSYKNLDYMCPRAKAFSMLGIADCLRQIGNIEAANKYYNEVKIYADIHKDYHLKMRILRGIIETNIISGNDALEMIEEYREEALSGGFLFAKVYGEIFKCRSLIRIDINQSLKIVEKIEELTRLGGTKLRLEQTHNTLIKGEILRRINDKESKELLNSALNSYSNMHVSWGILRAMLALVATESINIEKLVDVQHLTGSSHYEKNFIVSAINNPILACDILLVNMP